MSEEEWEEEVACRIRIKRCDSGRRNFPNSDSSLSSLIFLPPPSSLSSPLFHSYLCFLTLPCLHQFLQSAGAAKGLVKKLIDKFDTDGDGQLDKAELTALTGDLESEKNSMSDRLKALQGDDSLAMKIVAIHARGELDFVDPDIKILEGFKNWEPRIVMSKFIHLIIPLLSLRALAIVF